MNTTDQLKADVEDLNEPHMLNNLVICLSGPYGSGCSSLAEELVNIINDWPGCKSKKIKVSELIEQWHKKLIDNENTTQGTAAKTRTNQQQAGNALREKNKCLIGNIIANDIFAKADALEKDDDIHETWTLVYIVDSLKNISDLESLRTIYQNELFFCFVNANNDIRWRRMRDYKSWKEEQKAEFQAIDNIDSDEKLINPDVKDFGQQVKKLASFADFYFVNNSTREDLHNSAYRLVCLLFGLGISQPTKDEKCMHIAFSSANQSACLSRQVGAAIFTREGNILAIGHNDVPKPNGGLYSIEDNANDHRCLNVGERRCINDTNKEERFNNLTDEINENLLKYLNSKIPSGIPKEVESLFSGDNDDSVKKLISTIVKGSDFKDATEYCRAVHAEMDALMSVCRNLSGSTIGATVYVTTQPCHNCVKHLITAGVSRVVYIEPYPKSLGEELHSDAITLNPQSDQNIGGKISFVPYQGLAPRRYHDVFDMSEKRKDKDGKMCYKSKQEKAEWPSFAKKIAKRARKNDDRKNDLITVNELKASAEIYQLLDDQPKIGGQKNENGDESIDDRTKGGVVDSKDFTMSGGES